MGELRRALDRHEARRATARNSDMDRTQVESRIKVRGSGETRTVIDFPVLFSEKPIFTFGGELTGNSTPEATNYPVISVMVIGWKTIERSDQRTYYAGCEVAIVTLGKENQRVIAHCLFEGMAFRDPTVGSTSLTDPI